MTVRLNTAILFSIFLTGCALQSPEVNQTPDQIAASIEVTKDDFTGTTTLRAKRKGIDLSMTETLSYFYRYSSKSPDQVQLYVSANVGCWPYLNQAIGQDKTKMSVVKIDSDARSSSGSVYCIEQIGINVPLTYLEAMTAEDWTFRLYGGTTTNYDLTIDRNASQGFLQAVRAL